MANRVLVVLSFHFLQRLETIHSLFAAETYCSLLINYMEKFLYVLFTLKPPKHENGFLYDCMNDRNFIIQKQIVHWKNHLKFPSDSRLTPSAKDLICRLLCNVDDRIGSRGVGEIKVQFLTMISNLLKQSLCLHTILTV